jgi:hypothetical protein
MFKKWIKYRGPSYLPVCINFDNHYSTKRTRHTKKRLIAFVVLDFRKLVMRISHWKTIDLVRVYVVCLAAGP